MPLNVFITRKFPEEEMRVLKEYASELNVVTWDSEDVCPREKLLQSVVGVHGIMCTISDNIDKELLDAAGDQLKVITTVSGGTTHIDMHRCRKRKIQVYDTPDMASDSAAEFAVTLVLLLARRLLEGMDAVVRGEWGLWKPMWICGFEMGGRTLGLMGFGRVGFGIARRLKAFNMNRILYFDLCSKEYAQIMGAERVDTMDQLMQESDIVCICCAATPSNIKSINEESLGKMKKGSILINTARGVIVDHLALDKALRKGDTLIGAALDVTDPEPLPRDHPLLANPRCIITPHLGTATITTRHNMTREAVTNLRICLLDT